MPSPTTSGQHSTAYRRVSRGTSSRMSNGQSGTAPLPKLLPWRSWSAARLLRKDFASRSRRRSLRSLRAGTPQRPSRASWDRLCCRTQHGRRGASHKTSLLCHPPAPDSGYVDSRRVSFVRSQDRHPTGLVYGSPRCGAALASTASRRSPTSGDASLPTRTREFATCSGRGRSTGSRTRTAIHRLMFVDRRSSRRRYSLENHRPRASTDMITVRTISRLSHSCTYVEMSNLTRGDIDAARTCAEAIIFALEVGQNVGFGSGVRAKGGAYNCARSRWVLLDLSRVTLPKLV